MLILLKTSQNFDQYKPFKLFYIFSILLAIYQKLLDNCHFINLNIKNYITRFFSINNYMKIINISTNKIVDIIGNISKKFKLYQILKTSKIGFV